MTTLKKWKKFLEKVYPIILLICLLSVIVLLAYAGIRRLDGGWFSQYEDHKEPGFIVPVWQFLYRLFWMVLFSLGVIAIVAMISFLLAACGRWRTMNVFISYEHRHKDIVSTLKNVLKDRWVNPIFVPFEPTDHDTLIKNVQHAIKRSDLVIVLPGSERSFVDAEILTASALEKPLLFIKVTESQKTPDTSYKGYPVFDLATLQAYQYRPLSRFILYIGSASKDIIKNFYRTSMGFYQKQGLFILAAFFGCDTLTGITAPIVNLFVNSKWEQLSTTIVFYTFTAVAVLIFIISYCKVIWSRARAIRITRQKIRTGDLTFDLLSKGLDAINADKEILECILPQSLPTRYAQEQQLESSPHNAK